MCVCVCVESFLWVHHCAGQVSEHTWVGFKLLRTIYSKTETDIQLQNKDNKSEQKEVKIHQKSHCDRHDDQLHTQSLSLREHNIHFYLQTLWQLVHIRLKGFKVIELHEPELFSKREVTVSRRQLHPEETDS